MKDFFLLPLIVTIVAEMPTHVSTPWEEMGIKALLIAATIFLWRYFTSREAAATKLAQEDRAKREEADIAERNRLLEIQNDLQAEMVILLKNAKHDSDIVAEKLRTKPLHTIVENTENNPVITKIT